MTKTWSHKVYAIYDSKTEAYLQPFQAITRGSAIRSFSEAISDPKTSLHRWPSDYTLFEIGLFDERRGEYEMHESKKNLGLATEFVKPTQNDSRQLEAFPGLVKTSAPNAKQLSM